MDDYAKLVSKVLVMDSDAACYEKIKEFCDRNNLTSVKVPAENAMVVLRTNVDLGGILVSENFDGKERGGLLMARKIHALRPELPIFLRRDNSATLDGLSDEERRALSAAFTVDAIDDLRPVLDEFIFSLSYPNVFVRGIAEITQSALESQFKGLDVEVATPFIVRDRLIYGELFTLIPLESNWCRGYMMFQAEEIALLGLVKADKTHMRTSDAFDFRSLNGVLGEITNLVWGAIKSRYMSFEYRGGGTQVPIAINHLHRYISFGSDNPQLCFKYVMTDKSAADFTPLVIYQKFVFNLSWSPKDFKENQASIDGTVSTGDLDLF